MQPTYRPDQTPQQYNYQQQQYQNQPQYPYQPQYQYPVQPAKKGFPIWIPVAGVLALIAVAVVGILLVVLGPTSIASAELAKGYSDGKPVGATKVFDPTDNPFHFVVQVNNANEKTVVKAVWYVVDAADTQNQKIDESEIAMTGGKNVADFTLSLPNEWPSGKYKVELYLNDKLDRTVEFSVK